MKAGLRVAWGRRVGRWHFLNICFPSLADSSTVGSVVAECSLAELKDGVGL